MLCFGSLLQVTYPELVCFHYFLAQGKAERHGGEHVEESVSPPCSWKQRERKGSGLEISICPSGKAINNIYLPFGAIF